MNKKSAKVLTLTGFICLALSVLAFVFYLKTESNNLGFLFPILFVVGIILVILSLAYYTEI